MKKTFYSLYFKRFIDFNFASFALIILGPFLLFVSLLQILFNGFPIFFRQPRVGKDNKIFHLLKFRTMKNIIGRDLKLVSDVKRITWFGSFLRITSIDELPSLLNILKGEMSLIGPRPLLVEYLPLYNQEQLKRHLVRPGLSGLAQVKGRNALSWDKKFYFDLLYISQISFLLDIKIIFLTFFVIIFKTKNVNQSKNQTYEKFKGN